MSRGECSARARCVRSSLGALALALACVARPQPARPTAIDWSPECTDDGVVDGPACLAKARAVAEADTAHSVPLYRRACVEARFAPACADYFERAFAWVRAGAPAEVLEIARTDAEWGCGWGANGERDAVRERAGEAACRLSAESYRDLAPRDAAHGKRLWENDCYVYRSLSACTVLQRDFGIALDPSAIGALAERERRGEGSPPPEAAATAGPPPPALRSTAKVLPSRLRPAAHAVAPLAAVAPAAPAPPPVADTGQACRYHKECLYLRARRVRAHSSLCVPETRVELSNRCDFPIQCGFCPVNEGRVAGSCGWARVEPGRTTTSLGGQLCGEIATVKWACADARDPLRCSQVPFQ
jgi:hypothetical protein